MPIVFRARNIKCSGCATALREGLLNKHPQVRAVTINVPTGRVQVETEGEIRKEELKTLFEECGYPAEVVEEHQ